MEINKIIKRQKTYFKNGNTLNIEKRKRDLKKLLFKINLHEEEILASLKKDLGKSPHEAYLTEVMTVKEEIKFAIKNLPKWAKTKRVLPSISTLPSSCEIYTQPFGTALIISPWNYPFLLALSPLVSAISAGNTVILKTSKKSEHTSEIISKIIAEVFEKEHVCFLKHTMFSYEEILAGKYDFVFFTGSEKVGKKVMKACSENLTPLCLELGGKSPCIIDNTANLRLAAKKIAWGKLLNSGQTCVAPDYILVQKDIKNRFINELIFQIKTLYNDSLKNEDYPKIININQFYKTVCLLEKEKNNIVFGGNYDKDKLKIEPTILNNININSPSMESELFAPIFPILEFTNINSAKNIISKNPTPLALYLFSKNKKVVNNIINTVPFGGGCVNDTILHLSNNRLPFGGVGTSGMGSYHGKFGFDTFSRKKAIVKKHSSIDLPLRYPPYHKFVTYFFKNFS